MPEKILVLLGTKKGVFIAESDAAETNGRSRGPYCETWPINHAIGDPPRARSMPAAAMNGSARRSGSRPISARPGRIPAKASPTRPAKSRSSAVWSIAPRNGHALCGRAAGRAFSQRGSRRDVDAYGRAAKAPDPQGLDARRRRPDPAFACSRPRRRREDLGRHFLRRRVPHGGWRQDMGAAQPRHARRFHPRRPELSGIRPVRALSRHGAGNSDRLYQQNHCGMYRSDDGGRTWESIEAGLPSSFGFPAAAHPRDADTLFLLPLNGDSKGRFVPDAKAAVWRTRDGGQDVAGFARRASAGKRLFRRAAAGHGDRQA
jgi:hypothetical protein